MIFDHPYNDFVRHFSPGRERGSEHRSASSGHVRPRQAIGYMNRARDVPSSLCLLALAAD